MNRITSNLRYRDQVAVQHRHRQDRHRYHANANSTSTMMRRLSGSTLNITQRARPRTTAGSSKTQRPVVVLAGWLGCRPASLRWYQKMYESFGFDTIVVVASPVAVVDATIRMYEDDDDDGKRESDGNNPVTMRRKHQQGGEVVDNASSLRTMDDYAWKVLHDVHESIILSCPSKVTNNFFIFHAFSNGGCFVWESVCRIFDNAINNCNSSKMNENKTEQHYFHPGHKDLRVALELSSRCRGVVFDSCPAWFGSQPFKLWMALQHVITEESGSEAAAGGKNNVSSLLDGLSTQLGVEKHRIMTLDDSTRGRNLQYFDYLRGNSSPSPTRNINSRNSNKNGNKNSIVSSFPQLYLYSKDDPLTEYEYVQSIIDNNRQKGMVVFEKCWMDSTHCGHLKEHPNEYRAAVAELLQLITKQSKL